MSESRATPVLLGIIAVILAAAALHLAQSILAPVAFALFIIAIVWPVQRSLEIRLPKLLALVLTLLGTLVVLVGLALLIAWGFGRVGQWLVDNVGRLQALYLQKVAWLETHDVAIAGPLAEHFDVRWLIRLLQQITGTLQSFLSFATLTLVFTLLGLLEVGTTRNGLAALARTRDGAATLIRAGTATSAKLQRYMLVRTAMSLLTGVVIWAFARATGLELAAEWGVMAFVLNYIPFIGPLLATVLPTLFAVLQYESWEMALVVFFGLNVIQFFSGSYIEPRIAGAALALSPFVVLLAVFFWTFLWGIAGGFIGVPIVIACLTLCAEHPPSRWVAELLSGKPAAL
jgi:predicted PurR-regulated permease PerM